MVQIALAMFAAGALLGFVGAGGSGFIIALLTTAFGYPIHVALGTAITAMIFSSLSGAVSHYREGNVVLRTGIVVGVVGAVGAWASSMVSDAIPGDELKWLTAGMLFLSGLALWARMRLAARGSAPAKGAPSPRNFWVKACGVGLIVGAISGMFGIGATPFIQLGLMILLGLPIRQAAGTTMLVIIPIAIGGGAGYYHLGYLNMQLLAAVAGSMILGSYLGAKFTKRVPVRYLQTATVLFPIAGSAIMLL
jgi:uncharacterized membrane protein YfcA